MFFVFFPFYNNFNWRTSLPLTGREWTRKWNRPERRCYCPCSCSRHSDWATTGTRAWSSWTAGPSPSWGWSCRGWRRARIGRLCGDLCSGAPAAGAGRFPPVVADAPRPVPAPAETAAAHRTQESCVSSTHSLACFFFFQESDVRAVSLFSCSSEYQYTDLRGWNR